MHYLMTSVLSEYLTDRIKNLVLKQVKVLKVCHNASMVDILGYLVLK
jgi:hypothetical protein